MRKILLLKGQSRYNVLRCFVDALEEGFCKNDCDVEVLDFCTEDVDSVEERLKFHQKNPPDAVVAFNGIMYDEIREYIDAPYIGWLVDHPTFHHVRIIKWNKNDYVACVDRKHAEMVEKHYDNIKGAYFMPHGGTQYGELKPFSERQTDVLFSGTYTSSDDCIARLKDNLIPFDQKIAFTLITNMQEYNLDLGEAVEKLLETFEIPYSQKEFTEMCLMFLRTDDYIRAFFREELIRTLTENGVKVDVYGENWENFDCNCKENLIIHEPVDYIKSLQIMADTKISINILPNFQEGGHERIFSAMLNGALCVTDSNIYLEKEFTDGEQIVYYSKKQINRVAGKVLYYLDSEEESMRIINNAYEMAKDKHTWEARAKQILPVIDSV